jgi:tol-pal system protein YbgF
MAARILVMWSLILVTLWMGVFGFFNKYFDGAELEKARVATLQEKLAREEYALAKSEFKFSEYKDFLASQGVRIQDQTSWSDPTRAVASVMAESEYRDLPVLQPGELLFKKAKYLFASGDYKRSSELFDDFLSQYPDHPDLPEAGYLLSESFYLSGQVDRSINTIEFMTNHFPETEFSAFALVRLGNIFEKQDRPDEAVEMYNLVIKNFPKSQASKLAESMLQKVNL